MTGHTIVNKGGQWGHRRRDARPIPAGRGRGGPPAALRHGRRQRYPLQRHRRPGQGGHGRPGPSGPGPGAQGPAGPPRSGVSLPPPRPVEELADFQALEPVRAAYRDWLIRSARVFRIGPWTSPSPASRRPGGRPSIWTGSTLAAKGTGSWPRLRRRPAPQSPYRSQAWSRYVPLSLTEGGTFYRYGGPPVAPRRITGGPRPSSPA